MRHRFKVLPILYLIIIASSMQISGTMPSLSSQVTSSEMLLTIQMERAYYLPGELVKIFGNLTHSNGTAIQDGTISIEVKDSNNYTFFLDITYTSSDGSFKTSFRLSSIAYVGQYIVYATAHKTGYENATESAIFYVTTDDLFVVRLDPIQVILNADALIMNKKTTVRVIVANGFSERKWVDIQIIYDFASETYDENGPTGIGIPLDPGLNRIYVPGGPILNATHLVEPQWIPPEGQYFVFRWTNTGTDNNITVIIDPDNNIAETDETNNEKTGSREVRNTNSLTIRYYKLRPLLPVYGTPSWNNFSETVNEGNSFINATYPVAGNEFSGVSVGTLWSSPIPGLGMIDDFLSLHIYAAIGQFDRAVGIVSDDYFPFHLLHVPDASNKTGFSHTSITQAALVRAGYWTTITHEIGHTYGLNRDAEDYDINPLGSFASGYWVTRKKEIPKAISFMGESPFRSFEYNSTYSMWVANSHYESLFDAFASSTAHSTSNLVEPSASALFVRGIAFENGTMEFRDMYLLDGGAVKYPEPGEWSLVFRNSSGQVLSETPFNVSFAMFGGKTLSNVTGFAFSVPYPTSSTTIQVWRNSTLILEKQVTSYAPSIEVLSPNGGEFLMAGLNCTVTWNASDLDGDPLAYTIAYSYDSGESWIPVATDVEGNSYVWNTSLLEDGSNYLVRVIATDGVNTGEDVSDNVFTVSKIHDLAVTDVTLSKVVVGQNYSMSIKATVQNNGECSENFNVTAYANTTTITTLTNVTLANGNSTILTLPWNTTSFGKGNYTISAQVIPVPYERNIEDNNFTDGTVLVTIAGDANGDGVVDIFDLNIAGKAYGSFAGEPRYSPEADITNDDHVDMRDIVVIARNYGKIEP